MHATDHPAEIFIEEIEALPADRFLDHFLTRTGVVYPDLPQATEDNLSNARKILENRFDLVGEEYLLSEGFSWKPNPSHDKEWQIAQHKFYFALDLIHAYRHDRDEAYLKKWVTLLDSWLNEMGSGYITLSDAQVEARRIEHWVYSFALLKDTPCRELLPPQFLRRFLERISTETRYISQNLKPVRNHRTFQLFAVFLVGVLFPELRLHPDFLQLGKEKLTENLLTDFLPDGVHVELSTHYHQLVLETALAFVELAQWNGITLDEALLPRLLKALEFSMFMQWPSGEIPLINDSDNGDHLELLRRGSRLFQDDHLLWAATLGRAGRPPEALAKHFERSGYLVFGDGWGHDPETYAQRQHLFYDCARLGEGSHSHYDLFSFCYYAQGEPIVIDPGRYTYSSDPDPQGIDWRRQFKRTASHNTVTIDGKDQTRYLSRTRHGPEVEILERDLFLGQRSDWVSAKARSSEYTPLHQRLFVYMQRQYLFILDSIQIEDGEEHECALHFHLSERQADRVSLEILGMEVLVRSPAVHLRSYRAPGMEVRMDPGWVSKKYGVKTAAPVVTMVQTGSQPLFFVSLVAPAVAPGGDLEVSSLTRMSSPGDPVLRFRVEGKIGGEAFRDGFLFWRGFNPETFYAEGITFRGRFLAFRRDWQGQVIYLLSQKAEQIEIEGGPHLRAQGTRNIEWPFRAKE
ncbi:MAG: alginate lyase family protein [Candidatus Tectomicrobia bacterium]|uniref:Alginate lyase family protein n=1 Tax=Tectimicrobiota bacterium TaxID=2528274 RepID=A0A932CKY0_UNCTE|nr:alginate lyase family protein [Candidatus Tectomicrobia bacterium]